MQNEKIMEKQCDNLNCENTTNGYSNVCLNCLELALADTEIKLEPIQQEWKERPKCEDEYR